MIKNSSLFNKPIIARVNSLINVNTIRYDIQQGIINLENAGYDFNSTTESYRDFSLTKLINLIK